MEMESGAPLLLFGYTFTAPGVAVFATNRNLNRLAIISIVDNKDQCGSIALNVPHPATKDFLDAVPFAFSYIATFGPPDWTTICITLVILLVLVASLVVLQWYVRSKYWTFAPPLQVEYDEGTRENT